jgi:hypothetical protein
LFEILKIYQKNSKLFGFSVEGIVGIPLGELKEIKMKANSLEKLKEMVEEKNWKKHDLKFNFMVKSQFL